MIKVLGAEIKQMRKDVRKLRNDIATVEQVSRTNDFLLGIKKSKAELLLLELGRSRNEPLPEDWTGQMQRMNLSDQIYSRILELADQLYLESQNRTT